MDKQSNQITLEAFKRYANVYFEAKNKMKKQVWYIYFTIYDGVKREDLNVWFPKQVEANTYVECLKEEWGDCLEKVAVRPGYVNDNPVIDVNGNEVDEILNLDGWAQP